ncbi:multidrug effflux MFS transporter [Helicobacter turcicus]|uniref:Multidrug effflux MFS transporter n=1 Tax=Helicobacter turcicus TaxID=2867412 RepID=A0ABS7JN59_9HELI|nr:multidrug effflux MFS transporter [Helicobacter turcicus]MBX7490848.1 multidrug effflux MFS transporter [Helicobacter turcicus]MBX7545702.1 multidrug effflux MFS transporter [Helicobacter turcicus]
MQNHTKIHGFYKFKLIFILAIMSSLAPLSTDMYLAALNHVQESFQTNPFLTQLSLASFFIAFAFGQLIYGPLSDIFGRKKPVLVGILIFIASSLGCVIIDDIHSFIILRFFEALGGCAGVVIARAIVNDLFDFEEAASVYALMMVFSSLAPMLSPTLGAFLIKHFPWQSIFTFLFLLGIFLFLMVLFGLKESAPHLKAQKFSHKETLKNYKFVLKDSVFLVYVFCSALTMATIFAYITGSNFVFINFFGISEQIFAFLFGLNALGFMLCASFNAKILKKFNAQKVLAIALLVMLLTHLIMLFNAYFSPKIWLFEISLFSILATLGFIMPNTTTLAMARFKDHSGTASAILGTAQFALAGIISFSVGAFEANTPLFLSFVMFICVFLANLIYFTQHKKLA